MNHLYFKKIFYISIYIYMYTYIYIYIYVDACVVTRGSRRVRVSAESFCYYPRCLPQGNTCVSMTKMRKMSPKSHQNDGFQVDFLKFFRKPQGGLYGCSMMYFDVLELWEPSWNDSGSIWDHSFFHHFFSKFWVISRMLSGASTHLKKIDLSIGGVNPN